MAKGKKKKEDQELVVLEDVTEDAVLLSDSWISLEPVVEPKQVTDLKKHTKFDKFKGVK